MNTLNHPCATHATSEIPNEPSLTAIHMDGSCFTPPGLDADPLRSSSGAAGDFVGDSQPAAPFSPLPPVQNPSPSVQNFSLPPASLPEFSRLPESARADLRRTLLALEQIHSLTSAPHGSGLRKACRLVSATFHNRSGFSPSSLRRKYELFQKTGNWSDLLNKAKAGPSFYSSARNEGESHCLNGRLPADFIEFWKTLCERNQRKCKPAHRELLRIWRTGVGLDVDSTDGRVKEYKEIPGYPLNGRLSSFPQLPPVQIQIPADPITGIPKGWSFENLNRHRPTDFELAAARHGRAAASAHRRMVLTSRVGLDVGQFILFDDQVYDFKINWLSQNGSCQRKAMRPLGLNALDLASACLFATGFKPTLLGEDGAQQKLKEVDMLWFVVHVLLDHGYRPEGTTFLVEHGTAAIRPDFEERIKLVTGGKVTVDRSGIFGAAAAPAFFEGPSRGNFRFKAWLESIFNLVRNESAMLPGQTGKDRDHCPEDLHGRDQYNTNLLRAMERGLQPASTSDHSSIQPSALSLPFLSWPQFIDFALKMYQRINARTDHQLEGWEKSGHIAHEWRLSLDMPWQAQSNFLALPAAQQQALTPYLGGNVALMRSRKLSPHEVFTRRATQLQRVDYSLLPALLGPQFAQVKTIGATRSGYIVLQDQDIDPDPMYFPVPSVPSVPSVASCSKVLCYLNPFNPTKLVLADQSNRFLTILDRQFPSSRADLEGIKHQLAAAKRDEAERLAPLQRRHAQAARDRATMHAHNASVLAGRPLNPDQLEARDRAADLATAADDALDDNYRPSGSAAFTPLHPTQTQDEDF